MLGWGERGESWITWGPEEKSGRYGKLGTKGNVKGSRRVKSCPGRAGPESKRQKPQRVKLRGAHRPRVSERWEPSEGMSHTEQPNVQGQSRGARSKQVTTGDICGIEFGENIPDIIGCWSRET